MLHARYILLVATEHQWWFGVCAVMSSHKVIGKMFAYQIQHRFNNIPVANLSSLDQSGKNGKFHLDIPDRNRWIHNPSREDHWTWSGHHHSLTGRSGDCSRVLPVTWRRLSVRERQRARHCHRSTACHFQPNRELFRSCYALSLQYT